MNRGHFLLRSPAIAVSFLFAFPPGIDPTNAAEPAFSWAVRAGSEAGGEKIRSLAVDAEGNACITGQFAGSADFGNITLESHGVYDCFVAKVAPDGTFLWARTIGGNKTERGYSIDADAERNVYVTGHFESDHIVFGNETLVNAGDFDIFLAKIRAPFAERIPRAIPEK